MPAGKTPLVLNMDETACKLFYASQAGAIASEPFALAGRQGKIAQQASVGNTKAALSLVALLCNNQKIQAHLPQFLIGNENILPVLGFVRPAQRRGSPSQRADFTRKECLGE